jgi:hypothetical protein
MNPQALTIFDNSQLPAHLAELNEQGNIVARPQTNQLSFRGKAWRVIVDGVENIVRNSGGDPVQSVQVTILDYNKLRSRAYYAGGFEEGKSTPPTCWSKDGVAPDLSVPPGQKQSSTCAACPQSTKGSRVTESGKEVAACAQFKRMVVVPLHDPSFVPLLIKIPQTSMWDKNNAENEARGFYAFDQYMDLLKRKGVNHTANITTKISFDARMSYPKLIFSAAGWTPAENVEKIKAQLAEKELIDQILNVIDVGPTHEGTAPAPEEFEQPAASGAVAAPAPAAPVAAPATATPAAATKPATRPRPAPKAAAATAAAMAPATDPDDTPASFAPPAVGAAAPAAAAPAAKAPPPVAPAATVDTTAAASGLGSLLAGWDA